MQRAAAREHWRESYVGTQLDDGIILEGFVDLIFREDDGSLVIIDYKTDSIPDAAVPVRAAYYAPQIKHTSARCPRLREPRSPATCCSCGPAYRRR